MVRATMEGKDYRTEWVARSGGLGNEVCIGDTAIDGGGFFWRPQSKNATTTTSANFHDMPDFCFEFLILILPLPGFSCLGKKTSSKANVCLLNFDMDGSFNACPYLSSPFSWTNAGKAALALLLLLELG